VIVQMTVHIAKNYMELPKIKVPLILGIWGGKGQGKTFQCMLAYKKLGIQPIVMSAGAPRPLCLRSLYG
jgi:pantothenate kinase-related protein Tda10